jgi:ABC-type multidrug transport system fused ATPase/permease subunit
MFSINYHGQKYFLTTDPIYHATRSSGEIISKLDRAWRSYEDFLDILTFEIIKIVISLITVAATFLYFDLWLGLISLTFFLLIAIAGIGGSVGINKFTVPEWIKTEDKLKDVTVETLQQAQHIRSVFASDQQMKKVEEKNKNMMTTMATAWYTHHSYELFVRYLYLASVGIIGFVIYNYILSGKIDPAIGISLLVTYILGSTDILWIGHKVQRLTESAEKARDLFTYVKKFGRQSYPVLEDDKQK